MDNNNCYTKYYDSKCYTKQDQNIWIECDGSIIKGLNCRHRTVDNESKILRCQHFQGGHNCRRSARYITFERRWNRDTYDFIGRCEDHQFCKKIPH